jgi:ankyrin repeat protein
VNVRANDGLTALILAASSGDTEIVRELLNRGADVSGKVVQTGKTALMLAKERDFTDVVELLRAAGAKE